MFATPINNTMYECKDWRLAKANANRIQPDAPEQDAPDENVCPWIELLYTN